MRMMMLWLGLALAGCTGSTLPDQPPAPAATGNEAAPAKPNAATTQAPASTPDKTPVTLDSLQLTQARVDCWAKVEQQKGLRDIDRRIAFVDKCVDEAAKAAP